MAEEIKQEQTTEIKPEVKQESKSEVKPEAKKEQKNKDKKVKKESARVNGLNLHLSLKQCMHICDMIRNRDIDTAQKMVEEVVVFKRVVEMNAREVGHRHGPGIMAGRYPITAAKEFIKLLKQLKANAMHNEVEIENCKVICRANLASKPWKSGGRRAKRCHVILDLVPGKKNQGKNIKQKNKGEKK